MKNNKTALKLLKIIRALKFRNLPIKFKLFIGFGLVILIMILLSLLMFKSYSQDRETNTLEALEKMNLQAVKRIDACIQDMSATSKLILLRDENNQYNEIFRKLQNSNVTGILNLELTRLLTKETYNGLLLRPTIHSIFVFNLKGQGAYSVQQGILDLSNFKPANEAWFRESIEKRGSAVYIGSISTTNEPDIKKRVYLFSVCRAIVDIEEGAVIGEIMVNCSINFLSETFKDVEIIPNQKSIIIDDEGQIIYDPDIKNISRKYDMELLNKLNHSSGVLKSIDIQGTRCLLSYKTSPLTGWKIINIVPLNELYRNIHHLAVTSILITLSLIILSMFFITLVSIKITKPLKNLVLLMNLVERNNFDVKIKFQSRDEIGRLAKTFNHMTGKIKKLINEVYIEKINQRDLELQMLRNQINPHFLYNTLEGIRMTAEIHSMDDISEMAFSLGKILRFGISMHHDIVTVREEIEYLNYYISLQKSRFGEQLHICVSMDESIYECKIIKLILQPIVENAIYHGLEGRSQDGLIQISGCRDEDVILFTITDNGNGMDPDKVNRLNDFLNDLNNSFKSIGLKNVHKRIQIYYGQEYGIKITNMPEAGISVTLRLPYVDS